ncbi:hypothetical protein btBTCAM1_05725 (plasmid) [Borrelia turicatae]
MFLVIVARSRIVPSDLAACPSLGAVAELLQEINKRKTILMKRKVFLK